MDFKAEAFASYPNAGKGCSRTAWHKFQSHARALAIWSGPGQHDVLWSTAHRGSVAAEFFPFFIL